MKFRDDINKVMDSVDIQIDHEMKNKILDQTTRRSESRQVLGGVRKKGVAVAMAAVLCIGTVAVGASELPKVWNATVAKMFNANEKVQEKLVKEGYADIKETKENSTDVLTATNNGITVSVKQTLSDKYGLLIYLDVKSTNGLKLTQGNRVFDGNGIYVDGKDVYGTQGAGFVENKYSTSDYETIYELYAANRDEVDITGKEIRVHLKNLVGGDKKLDDDLLVEGDWNLHWTVKSNSATKTIQLNGSYEGKGTVKGKTVSATYNLKALEISPLSFSLTYDCKDFGKVSKELDNELIPVKVVMKDGEVYARTVADGVDEDHIIGGGGSQDEHKEVAVFGDVVLDVDNIDYVEVAGVRYDVK